MIGLCVYVFIDKLKQEGQNTCLILKKPFPHGLTKTVLKKMKVDLVDNL